MTPFWYGWPSWVTELVGGAALALFSTAVAALYGLGLPFAILLAVVLSAFYEGFLDVNGWSWTDVGQRTVGIAVGFVLVGVLF